MVVSVFRAQREAGRSVHLRARTRQGVDGRGDPDREEQEHRHDGQNQERGLGE
jgi:hypothetical protein